MSAWFPNVKESPIQGLTGLWGGVQGSLSSASPPPSGGPGTDSTNPANHASQVSTWTTTNDWYWIRTTQMPAAKKVYCNLNDDGGDWMLVSYAPAAASNGILYPNKWTNGEGSATAFSGTTHMSVDLRDLWWNGTVGTSTNIQCTKIMYGMNDTSVTTAPTNAQWTRINRQTYVSPNELGLLDSTTIAQDSTATWPSPDNTIGSCGVIQWTGLKGYDSTWPNNAQGQSVAIDHTDKRWLFGGGGWYNPSQDSVATDYGQGQGYDVGIWVNYFSGATTFYGFGDWTYPGTTNRSLTGNAWMQWVK